MIMVLLLFLLFPLLLSRGDCCGIASARRAVGVAATTSPVLLLFEDVVVGVDGEFLDCSASLVFGANDTLRLMPVPSPPAGEFIAEEEARSSSSSCCL